MANLIICLILVALPLLSAATPVHPRCEEDATPRALKLLKFYTSSDGDPPGQDVGLYPGMKVIAPIRNPAKPSQKLDVYEFTGYSYKGAFRIRLIYLPRTDYCVMVGEEILTMSPF
ncbi:MAG: hypothetical protein KGO01_08620 [Burkholderiales bacterium]|nr:hypothetical protein [Burkholderiales bacterium]MDE1926731.1 hypothetical protein [Burkholderiales bacterium]